MRTVLCPTVWCALPSQLAQYATKLQTFFRIHPIIIFVTHVVPRTVLTVLIWLPAVFAILLMVTFSIQLLVYVIYVLLVYSPTPQIICANHVLFQIARPVQLSPFVKPVTIITLTIFYLTLLVNIVILQILLLSTWPQEHMDVNPAFC